MYAAVCLEDNKKHEHCCLEKDSIQLGQVVVVTGQWSELHLLANLMFFMGQAKWE